MTVHLYISQRDERFEYATDALAFVERTNCAKGCVHATDATREEPGGTCDVLAHLSLGGGEVVPELVDEGRSIRCTKREAPAIPSILPSQAAARFERDGWVFCGRVGSTQHRGCHKRSADDHRSPWVETTSAEKAAWKAWVGDDGVTEVLFEVST